MMIIMQFTSQIILLAIGFGVGYLLLVSSVNQQGTLKTIGQALGGILIVMAMILAIFSCYYSMKISSKGYMQGGCPVQKMMNQQEAPIMNGEQSDVNEDVQKNKSESEMDNENAAEGDDTSDTGDKSIKSSIKDHE